MFKDAITELKKNGKVFLRVKIKPASGRNQATSIMADGTIKIDVAAPPEDGRANRELLRFLAQEFGAAEDAFKIISGRTGKNKLIKIKNI